MITLDIGQIIGLVVCAFAIFGLGFVLGVKYGSEE